MNLPATPWLKKYLPSVIALCLLAAPRLFAQAAALRDGDSVEIHIAGVPVEDQQQFQNVYTVDENGQINLPYIGLVKAGGMAPSAVQTEIQNALISAQIYTNPTITVQPSAGARYINVGGAVRQPGRVQYTSDLTLMSTINAAGGFSDFAGDKIRLVRKGKVLWFSHKKLDKDPTQDPPMAPGDSVDVKESLF
jgi:polysaccharide export outer membrane protein